MSEDIEKLAKNQAALQKNVIILKNKVDALTHKVDVLEGTSSDEDEDAVEENLASTKEDAVAYKTANKTEREESTRGSTKKSTKESSGSEENTGFKIFGAIGFFLILLGFFYMYNYAVDQGWIGYGGRVVLGVLFALLIIGLGEVFRRKEYANFSQLLMGGGTGLLYFVTYATYVFPEYRNALGMSQGLNTALLFVVMVFAVGLALWADSKLLTIFAFVLGFLSAIISGSIHQAMIATILLAGGMSYIIWMKKWSIGIVPVTASYFVYLIFFFSHNVLGGYGGVLSADTVPAFIYLIIMFVLFNLLSIAIDDEKTIGASLFIAIINAFFFLCFGLTIVHAVWEQWDGTFLLITSGAYFLLMYVAKMRNQRMMFETFFLIAVGYITIAIPVQLDNWQIAIAWAIEGVLLVRSGLRVQTKGIRVIGYISLGLASLSTLVTSWNSVGERVFTYLFTIAALYGTAYLLSTEEKPDDAQRFMKTLCIILGTLLLTIMIRIETLDPKGIFATATLPARHMVLTLAWSIEAAALFLLGQRQKTTSLRLLGSIMFSIAIGTLLFVNVEYGEGARLIAYLGVITTLFIVSYFMPSNEEMIDLFPAVSGVLLVTIMLAIEVSDASGMLAGLSSNARNVLLSVSWAVESILLIVIGFLHRAVRFRWIGAFLFGITVLKILLFDMGNLESIYRIIVTMIVGAIALGTAFFYIKNKERIAVFLKEK